MSVFSRSGRELGRLAAANERALARISNTGSIARAEVRELTATAREAELGVALVTQMEQQLGQLVPLAVSRLQAIGDAHALGCVGVVMHLANGQR